MKPETSSALALLLLAACASGPAPAVVIDVRGPAAALDDLLDWESRHGRVPDGSTVVFRGAREAAPDLAERVSKWRLWAAMRFEPRRTARLIEFGWDIPDTAALRANAAAMERAPFDGVVLDPKIGRPLAFSWHVFGRERLPDGCLDAALADLQATRLFRFKHNFLRFNATPGDAPLARRSPSSQSGQPGDGEGGWDDHPVIANVRLAGRFVREAELAGLMFDVEPYQGKQWSNGTADDARRLGRAFGRAYAAEAPRSTILLTFGITQASHPEYRLLGPFVEGLLEADVEVVDGFENAYGFKETAAFERAREAIRKSHPRIRAGFGLWMDFESGRRAWPANAFFSPDEFERAVRAASAASDGWVWIYTERLNWWTGEGLPDGYRAAVERARE